MGRIVVRATTGNMHCRQCRYQLNGLDAGACPECGRHFDPEEPDTYATDRLDEHRKRLCQLGGGLAAVLAAILVHSLYANDTTSPMLVIIFGGPGLLIYFLGVVLLRSIPSLRGMLLCFMPALFMIGLYYSLALHMWSSLQGWPTAMGTHDFPRGLIVHADVALSWFTWLLLLVLFGGPIALLVCLGVRRWNHGLFHLGLLVLSFALGLGVMQLAPRQFLSWWWD